MDPNATLKSIDAALKAGDSDSDVDEACDDLRSWIRHGGFEPNWSAYPLAASYYATRKAEVAASFTRRKIDIAQLPTPKATNLKRDSKALYGALVCILADLDSLGHVGPETKKQAEGAVLRVHDLDPEPPEEKPVNLPPRIVVFLEDSVLEMEDPSIVLLPSDSGLFSIYLAKGQKMPDPNSTKRFFYGPQHLVIQRHIDGSITVSEGSSRE